jgi:flagellar hook-basal body complex protein FliE
MSEQEEEDPFDPADDYLFNSIMIEDASAILHQAEADSSSSSSNTRQEHQEDVEVLDLATEEAEQNLQLADKIRNVSKRISRLLA